MRGCVVVLPTPERSTRGFSEPDNAFVRVDLYQEERRGIVNAPAEPYSQVRFYRDKDRDGFYAGYFQGFELSPRI